MKTILRIIDAIFIAIPSAFLVGTFGLWGMLGVLYLVVFGCYQYWQGIRDGSGINIGIFGGIK